MSEYLSCTHPPNVRCVRCMNRDAESETREQQKQKAMPQRCTHGPNQKCLRCMGAASSSTTSGPVSGKKTGMKKVRAVEKAEQPQGKCNHGEGVFCINCMPASARAAAKEGATIPISILCNHPPGVVCVNCMPRPDKPQPGEVERPAITTDPLVSRRLTAQCNHDATMFCEHCLPPPPPVDPYTLPPDAGDLNDEDPPERRCVHHGPHGSCLECMAIRESRKMIMKRQEKPRATKLRVDHAALDCFQSFIRQHKTGVSAPPFRRMAWMLGTVNEEDGVTTVHALYEPPQSWPGSMMALRDAVPNLDNADNATEMNVNMELLCGLLGLRIVGWAFSHDARREILTTREVERMTAWQKQFGPGFVTLVLKCSYNSKKQCVINAEAFQVSDQAVELYARHNFDYEGGIAVSPTALRLKRPVVSEKKDTKAVDVAWLIVPVPVVSYPSTIFRMARFPAPGRPGIHISGDYIVAFLREVKETHSNPFSDFNFLLFVSMMPLFSSDVDVPIMCDSLSHQREIGGFIAMLNEVAPTLP